MTRSLPDWEVLAQEKLLQRTLHAHAACLDHLLRAGKIPTALANCRLPAAQTQFCLRHYLDGLSDSVRLLTASELDNSPALLQAMQLKTRSLEDATGDNQHTRTTYQGMREVQVVACSKQGRHVETVAFDPNAEGYAQVKSVWPGQVAEFFSRHSPLRVHELFTETRNSLLLACTRS